MMRQIWPIAAALLFAGCTAPPPAEVPTDDISSADLSNDPISSLSESDSKLRLRLVQASQPLRTCWSRREEIDRLLGQASVEAFRKADRAEGECRDAKREFAIADRQTIELSNAAALNNLRLAERECEVANDGFVAAYAEMKRAIDGDSVSGMARARDEWEAAQGQMIMCFNTLQSLGRKEGLPGSTLGFLDNPTLGVQR